MLHPFRSALKQAAVAAAIAGLCLTAAGTARAADAERQIGAQEYALLQQKGAIVTSSPWYRVLNPIAERIKRVADPQYDYPFHFVLVHDAAPNAFAVPGGNVYVTDSLMKFVQNQQQLAGVLCHETSHDIHHDVINLNRKDQNLQIGATVLSILLGGGRSGIVNGALNAAGSLESLNFSRGVESNADKKGAYTCAQAGYNPYGLVWLFQNFEKADTHGSMEMLSDHPNDQHRIDDLKREFAADPATFGKFRNDINSATPMPKLSTLEAEGPAGPMPGYQT
jgi:beta-barrel assembly-enhancing protease